MTACEFDGDMTARLPQLGDLASFEIYQNSAVTITYGR